MELTIEYLDLSSNISDDNENGKTACLNLNLADEHSENEEDMIVSLPKLDPEEMGQLSNIWFPFKRKHTFNLKSQHSAFILIKYFVSVSRCCHSQGVPQFTFNQRFKEWIAEHIEPHLNDEVLYPGLGAVLRILETIEKENKSTRSSKQSHSIKSSRDSLKPKKANAPTADPKLATLPKASQIASKTGQVESKPKEKLNFFQQFFDRNLADAVDNDEKNPDLKGDENFKVKRKNYIIAAVAVSVILMVFVCIVAIMTKNIREICKGRAQQKKLKKRRQKELEREVGGSTGPLSLGKNRYRKQPKRSHEEEGLTTTASSTVSKESMTDVQQYQYEYGSKYDCRPEPSAMFFPMCKQRPPPYNRQISRDSSPQTKPAKPTVSKQSRRSKAGTELCQNCGQQLPGRNQVGGRDYVNYCFCKSRESLGEPPPTIEPTRQPSPPPIFQSKSPQKPQLTTCLRLPTPPKPRRRLSPRIKPVQPSLSPPKFSISKKNKPAKETSFRLGSPKKSSMKKTKSKLGETRVVLRQDLPCQCPSNSKCKHSPGNFESKSSTHSLESSPSTAEHTTAAKHRDSLQPAAGPSQNRSSPPRKHPPSKSCPNFGRKHEFVSTSWETLDSKRE
ncbi:pinin [Hermetia illucens]|nr:pinin [Hermetia illucens]